MFKQSAVMFGSLVVANGFAYLYHIFMARHLGPAAYGELGSLLAIFMILAVPAGTIQLVIARFVARYAARSEVGKIGSVMFAAIRKFLIYGIGIFFLMTVLSPRIADFLRLDAPLPVILVGLTVVFSVILPVNRGVLQGIQGFHALAMNTILESACRLILGVALVLLGLGVNGAVGAFGLGYLLAFLFAFPPLRRFFKPRDWSVPVSEMYRFARPVFCSVLLMNCIVYLPTIAIKHLASAEFAGRWNVALILAGIALFIASAVSFVVFPKVSASSDPLEKRRLYATGLGYTACGSIGSALVFYFFSRGIVTIFFGEAYAGGDALLRWMGFGMACIAVGQYTIYYRLAGISAEAKSS